VNANKALTGTLLIHDNRLQPATAAGITCSGD